MAGTFVAVETGSQGYAVVLAGTRTAIITDIPDARLARHVTDVINHNCDEYDRVVEERDEARRERDRLDAQLRRIANVLSEDLR